MFGRDYKNALQCRSRFAHRTVTSSGRRKIKSDTFPINSPREISRIAAVRGLDIALFSLCARKCPPNPPEIPYRRKRGCLSNRKDTRMVLEKSSKRSARARTPPLIIIRGAGVEIRRVGGMFVFNCVYPSVRCQRDIRQRCCAP